MDHKEIRRYDDFIIYAMAAAKQAMKDSGLELKTEDERCRAGVLVGSGIGGLSNIADTTILMETKGPRRISPFFIPGSLINLAGGLISIEFGCKGPNHRRRDGVFDGIACHWRCGPHHCAGRCRRHDRRRAPNRRSAESALPASSPARPWPPGSTMRRKRDRAPMMPIAMVS